MCSSYFISRAGEFHNDGEADDIVFNLVCKLNLASASKFFAQLASTASKFLILFQPLHVISLSPSISLLCKIPYS